MCETALIMVNYGDLGGVVTFWRLSTGKPTTLMGQEMSVASEGWLWRHALMIAAQLPESPEEARIVLGYAQMLVERPSQASLSAGGHHEVLDFRPVGPSSPRRRARATGSPSARPK
jgi:hypothetical protein